jgi:hypothetical protein
MSNGDPISPRLVSESIWYCSVPTMLFDLFNNPCSVPNTLFVLFNKVCSVPNMLIFEFVGNCVRCRTCLILNL